MFVGYSSLSDILVKLFAAISYLPCLNYDGMTLFLNAWAKLFGIEKHWQVKENAIH